MTLIEAFTLIMSLAADNAIDDKDGEEPGGAYHEEWKMQQEAFAILHDFIVNNFGDN